MRTKFLYFTLSSLFGLSALAACSQGETTYPDSDDLHYDKCEAKLVNSKFFDIFAPDGRKAKELEDCRKFIEEYKAKKRAGIGYKY